MSSLATAQRTAMSQAGFSGTCCVALLINAFDAEPPQDISGTVGGRNYGFAFWRFKGGERKRKRKCFLKLKTSIFFTVLPHLPVPFILVFLKNNTLTVVFPICLREACERVSEVFFFTKKNLRLQFFPRLGKHVALSAWMGSSLPNHLYPFPHVCGMRLTSSPPILN